MEILTAMGDPKIAVALQVVVEETQPQFKGHETDAVIEQGHILRAQEPPGLLGIGRQDLVTEREVEAYPITRCGFAPAVATGAQTIPQIVLDQPRLDRIEVDQGQRMAVRCMEEDVVDLRVAMGDALVDKARSECVLQHPLQSVTVIDEGDAGRHRMVDSGMPERRTQFQVAGEIIRSPVKTGEREPESVRVQVAGQAMEAPQGQSHLAGLLSGREPLQTDRVRDQFHQPPQVTARGSQKGFAIPGRGQRRYPQAVPPRGMGRKYGEVGHDLLRHREHQLVDPLQNIRAGRRGDGKGGIDQSMTQRNDGTQDGTDGKAPDDPLQVRHGMGLALLGMIRVRRVGHGQRCGRKVRVSPRWIISNCFR